MDAVLSTVLIELIRMAPAIIAAIAAAMALLASRRNTEKINDVHQLINSRLTELLDLTRASARAEGILEGKFIQNNEGVLNGKASRDKP